MSETVLLVLRYGVVSKVAAQQLELLFSYNLIHFNLMHIN